MSFMFNPSPYEENAALNYPILSDECVSSLKTGTPNVAAKIAEAFQKGNVILMDGYVSADFVPLVNLIKGLCEQSNMQIDVIPMEKCYKSAEELDKEFEQYLPCDKEKDPVLLFGKRIEGGYKNIIDNASYGALLSTIKESDKKLLIFGFGAAFSEELRSLADFIVYLDVAPKHTVLRARSGKMKNIGDAAAKPFKLMMRRAYYIDFEISLELRRKLMNDNLVDFYVDSTNLDCYKMLPKKAFGELCEKLAVRPFRNKPVYIEGVWGGQYVKRVRSVGNKMNNIAWAFDFIPMEVSIVSKIGDFEFEMPFYTLLQHEEEKIMGKKCCDKFNGYFPIRFNYDDTYHSSGNMSVQVHSGSKYNKENYNEFGRQDESYYIIAAGHGAKTYLGFNNGINPDDFIAEAKKSEKEHTLIDYQKYINAVHSEPGVQVMIPAGTIHASGRNQLILEIGSLTVGSYTYKMYDYLRLDLDGIPRPIHTYHGERVLEKSRNTDWINANVVQKPRVVREGDGFKESIIGEHDLLYFSLRHLEFEKEIEDNTNGKFHVLSLVNGEHVVVQSVENPELCYYQNYLDIVLVPASVGKYKIINLGNQPVTMHKTCLKEGFENDSL